MIVDEVRREMFKHAVYLVVGTAFIGAILVLVFGWPSASPFRLLVGTAIGAAVFGTISFGFDVRERVPRGTLWAPPEDYEVATSQSGLSLRQLAWMAALVSACVGLAWLVDWWDLSAALFPGQLLGYAGAELLGAVLVGRWEGRHSKRVVAHEDGSDTTLYAIEPA